MSALYVLYAFGLSEETLVNLPHRFERRVTPVQELEAVEPALETRHVLITTEIEAVRIGQRMRRLTLFIVKSGVPLDELIVDPKVSLVVSDHPTEVSCGQIEAALMPLFKPVTNRG